MHEFKIADEQARKHFSKLLGFEIRLPVLRLKRDTYLKYAGAIQGIQMNSAFRVKRS